MSEITNYNYQKIRDLEEALIKYIEIRDNLGVKIIRIPTTDPRVTHVYNRLLQEQVYSVLIKGTDSDIIIPCTIGGSALYETAVSTDVLALDITTTFQINATEDSCTVIYKLQIPTV